MGRKLGITNGKSIEIRFWDKVKIDNKTGCWYTKSMSEPSGFYIDPKLKAKNFRIAAWYIIHKTLPNGILGNICGNHRCINPEHYKLFSNSEDRFWSHVDKKPDDECWNWQAKKDPKGYGIFNTKNTTKAHRFSWSLINGEISSGMFICHHCDNPSCVNPNHLFIGTAKDNNLDKVRKGRSKGAIGIHNSSAKLNDIKVKAIRFLYENGKFSTYDLEKIFDVSRITLGRIIKRKLWKHVAEGNYENLYIV